MFVIKGRYKDFCSRGAGTMRDKRINLLLDATKDDCRLVFTPLFESAALLDVQGDSYKLSLRVSIGAQRISGRDR